MTGEAKSRLEPYMSYEDSMATMRILGAFLPFGVPALRMDRESEEWRMGALIGFNSRDQYFFVPSPPAMHDEKGQDFAEGWLDGHLEALAEEYDDDIREELALKFTNNKFDLWDMLDYHRGDDDERKGNRPWVKTPS